MHTKIKQFTEEVDSVINISNYADANPEINIKSPEVFDEYEKIRNHELKSILLTYQIASEYLSPTGYIAFSSSVASLIDSQAVVQFKTTDDIKSLPLNKSANFLEQMSKWVTM